MDKPKISILLPTYNAAMHLSNAIDSILGQSFDDFELIIVDDGSVDHTQEVLAKYADPRIVVLTQENMGLPKALNRAIENAKGMYLARQDADDISHPERLQKQVDFLDQNPDYALVGTWTQIITPAGPTERRHTHPISNGQIQIQLLINNQFVHSSVMLRADCLKTTGLYSENSEDFPPEDYDLWLKIAKHFKVANIPEVLLQYLELPTSISRTKEQLINTRTTRMARNVILTIPGLNVGDEVINDFIATANGRSERLTLTQCLRVQSLISKIQIHVNHRFPYEANDIAKGVSLLRTQAHKALIKSLLRRFLN